MTRAPRLFQTTALALLLSATASHAELTASDVWTDWKAYMDSAGYTVSAQEVQSGNTVTVNDLTLTTQLEADADEGTATVSLGTIVFAGNGDGTVSITLPAQPSMAVATTSDEGEDVSFDIDINQADVVMTAEGAPEDVTYNYAASSVSFALADLTVDGVTLTESVAKAAVTLSDLAYVTQSRLGDLRTLTQNLTAARVDYDIAFEAPDDSGAFSLLGEMQTVTFEGDAALPADADQNDVNTMLNNGFAFDGTFLTQGGTYTLTFNSPDGSGTVNSTAGGAELSMAMDQNGIRYGAAQSNVAMNMLLTELPLPISVNAARSGVNMTIPVQKSEAEQEFALGVELTDFVMSDVIWGLFDPAGQLPRDPATLALDLSGKARVLFDFLDPAQAAILEQTDAAPGELNALTLNKLELDAVGARLTGNGDFVFDNGDLATFDGLPRPKGGIDLTLVGGNGLIDKLVGMGLLPEDQAMGARMMMGLFAVPGEGEDTLNSRIEVNDEGHVLANGQRLR